MKARLGRALLLAALLLAQQAALVHQLWHASLGVPGASATAVGNERGGSAPQEALCDLHSALGAVLGALNGGASAMAPLVVLDTGFAALRESIASLAAPAPASRDPPRLA